MKSINKVSKKKNGYQINESSILVDGESLENILKEAGVKDTPQWFNCLNKVGVNFFKDNYLDFLKEDLSENAKKIKISWKEALIKNIESEPAEEPPETITIDPDEEPVEIPTKEVPQTPEKVNPFKKPNIKPGTEPQPKANVKEALKKKAALKIHPHITEKIDKNDTPYHSIPSIPSGTFLKDISSSRFQYLLKLLERYSHIRVRTVSDIAQGMMALLQDIQRTESEYIPALEDLAISIVKDLYGIEDEIEFDAKIERVVNNDSTGGKIKNLSSPEVNVEEQLTTNIDLSLESAKRRFINGLIQGAAINSLHAFHLVKRMLDRIDPSLTDKYALFSIFTELGYWVTPPLVLPPNSEDESDIPAPVGGMVRVDLSGEVPKIIARAVNFPILVQELVKGVMELISMHGLPEDEKLRNEVLSQADSLEDESWDIRFGPEIWKKILTSIDGEINNRALSILYYKLVQMPSPEFHDFINRLLKKDKNAIESLNNMYRESLQQI
jgi:hypothetical protein